MRAHAKKKKKLTQTQTLTSLTLFGGSTSLPEEADAKKKSTTEEQRSWQRIVEIHRIELSVKRHCDIAKKAVQ